MSTALIEIIGEDEKRNQRRCPHECGGIFSAILYNYRMPPLSHPLRSALVIILALLLSLAALFATLSLRKWMSAREPEPQQRSGITEVERQHLIESTSATSGAKQDEKETQKQRDAVTAKVPNNPLSKEEQQRLIQAASAP